MTDIKDLIIKAKPQPPQKFIVIGEPLSGKTTLAAKAPKPLFLSTDGNAAKAGLDAINIADLNVLRSAIEHFKNSDEYETLVIDTIEGISDLFEAAVITTYNDSVGQEHKVSALQDVGYGRLTGQFNRRLAAFSETLRSIPKNVIILSYTKRKIDDITGAIVLDSELKGIRHFTKFADAMILTSYDGDRHEARVINKRTVMAGEVDYAGITDFLTAAGWDLPKRKTKINKK